MLSHDKHTIASGSPLKVALKMLNEVPRNLSLFVLNKQQQLIGTVTDGDIRRGLLAGKPVEAPIDEFMFTRFQALKGGTDPHKISQYRALGIKLVPILNQDGTIERIIDLGEVTTCLPVDAVIMAGGRGERLRPLTDKTPKPMLPLGNKPIIEHNIDRLKKFGITNIHISINYLGEQLIQHFGDGSSRQLNIQYIKENSPLGTIGSISLVNEFENPYILVLNSDLFTDANFEDLWLNLVQQQADLCVASIPYTVSIPFAIMQRSNGCITGIKEKPTTTHYANAGIYLIKKTALQHIPKQQHFNATDLIETLINNQGKVIDVPLTGYWIDIGRHEEYEKAKEIIKHLSK